MRRFQWKSKETAALVAAAIFLYLMLRTKGYSYYASVNIPKVKPTAVWEFVADFSNMKYLNPTIVDFNIISESGNYDHWKYTVQYAENLSHWPHLYNVAVAQFDIKGDQKKDIYRINSVHRTCMLYGNLCFNSESEFKFSKNTVSGGALCEEFIEYQCPVVMSNICLREVEYQRRAIMDNLKAHFQYKNSRYT